MANNIIRDHILKFSLVLNAIKNLLNLTTLYSATYYLLYCGRQGVTVTIVVHLFIPT